MPKMPLRNLNTTSLHFQVTKWHLKHAQTGSLLSFLTLQPGNEAISESFICCFISSRGFCELQSHTFIQPVIEEASVHTQHMDFCTSKSYDKY